MLNVVMALVWIELPKTVASSCLGPGSGLEYLEPPSGSSSEAVMGHQGYYSARYPRLHAICPIFLSTNVTPSLSASI